MKLWKVQKVFEDVVYDLRSRGLLPVVILLVIAMIAVPMLISRGSSSSSGSVQPAAATVKTAPETEQAVVSYSPAGLRNYKSRLNRLSPKDPFRQPEGATVSAAAASQLSSTVTAPSVSSSSSGGATASPGSSVAAPGGSGTSAAPVHRYYFYSVADLSVGDPSQPLERHKHIKPFTSLPNQVAPVMIYLGSSLDGKRAYFSISKMADQLTGPGTCVPSPTDCSLLALSADQTEDMVYSVDGKTYRVKINKITRVVSNG